ncbi:fimbrial protein [Enterobacter asburiae]|uniref:fimbrial protein n=1 Tax=Enterobacter asburiae TaxID=61645 RepID=UPI00296671DB|nr:fimbrial protein [Enterobacter asburiae]MDW3577825.1 fimbrial protein [Enterobacter asburiae]
MSNMNMPWAMLTLAMLMAGATCPLYGGTPVEFKGNLVVPLCTINNNNPVTVSFGDVDLQTMPVSGIPYNSKDFSVAMLCPYTLGKPMLTVTSASVYSANLGIINTSKSSEGLVVFLRQKGGSPLLPLGTPTDVTSSIAGTGTNLTLTLNAALGQMKGMDTLTPGLFTATANLQVQYQ